jgi:hypothetical protein
MKRKGAPMPRRRKPKYLRSLVNLLPGLFVGAGACVISHFDECSMMPAAVECPGLIPAWGYLVAFAAVIGSVAWTCWAWYKDHIRGDYEADVMMGKDRYRD